MREILFRGKTNNDKWVEGSLVHRTKFYGDPDDSYFIIVDGEFDYEYYEAYEVIPETVGRLIEHPCYNEDWNQRIFEGDIVEVCRSKGKGDETHLAIVVNESCLSENGMGRWFPQDTVNVKVIGNVHDNPELVGVSYADLYKYYNCINGKREDGTSKHPQKINHDSLCETDTWKVGEN